MELNFNSVFVLASLALSALIGIPACCLLTLTLSAAWRREGCQTADTHVDQSSSSEKPRTVVLVPAHNESVHILPTLHCLKQQLGAGDRLVVVADNCTDDTAAVAAAAGAEVLERHDAAHRGKGYALAFGVEAMRSAPPDVLIIIDADCKVSPGGIQSLAQHCHSAKGPVQMLDLMVAPAGAGLRTRMLEFAWTVKNHVRPLGSQRIGGACHLMGTGMALPWNLAATARLATGHIAEDMKLGVDMAIAGRPTRFITNARVISEFPTDVSVAKNQKSRWEHGHLTTLKEELPRLLAAWVRQPRLATLVLAMDLAIPPLALYFLCAMASLVIFTALAALDESLAPAMWVAVFSAAALFGAVMLSWANFARGLLTMREMLTVPLYAAWKIPVYIAFFLNRKSGWIRTARSA